ncbi:hypothetical protein [Rouxiella sp. Mn2063]
MPVQPNLDDEQEQLQMYSGENDVAASPTLSVHKKPIDCLTG